MKWPTAPLGDICEIVSGATPKTGESSYWGGDIAWATPADLSKLEGPYINSTPRTLTNAGLRSCAASVLPAGSVLLSSRAPIGHVAINARPMATNQGFKSLIPASSRVDSKYLYYWLRSKTEYLQSLGNGATFKEVSKAIVARVEVPVPPLEEQLRIAAILDKADALRTKRISSSRLLNDVEDAIFQSMFAHASFSTVSAGDVMPTMRNGLSPSRAGKHVANVLTLSAVTQGSFDPTAAKYGTFKNEPPIEQRVSAADFLMCRGNGNLSLVGVGTFADEDRADLVFPDTVIAGRVDQSKISLPFLAAVWRHQSTRSQIEAVARTTNGTYKVNQQTLAGVTVPLPPLALQQEFADRVRLVSEQRRVAETSSRVMENLFASLQSRAFAGEL